MLLQIISGLINVKIFDNFLNLPAKFIFTGFMLVFSIIEKEYKLRLQKIQYGVPYFKGTITLSQNCYGGQDRVLQVIETTAKDDERLWDAFIKAARVEEFSLGVGLGQKDENYYEYLKTLKEISGIDAEEIARRNKDVMYGHSHCNDPILKKRHYSIELNENEGIHVEHKLKLIPKDKTEESKEHVAVRV